MTNDFCPKCGKTANEVSIVQFAGLCDDCATKLVSQKYTIDGLTMWIAEKNARAVLKLSNDVIEKEAAGNFLATLSNLRPTIEDTVSVVEPVAEEPKKKEKKNKKKKSPADSPVEVPPQDDVDVTEF